jgi:hypothetical protein
MLIGETYSVAGQVVQTSRCIYDKRDKQIRISVGNLLTGTYLVRLTHQKTRKFYSEHFVVKSKGLSGTSVSPTRRGHKVCI